MCSNCAARFGCSHECSDGGRGSSLHKVPRRGSKTHQSQAESSGQFENFFRHDQSQELEIESDTRLRGKYAGYKWAFSWVVWSYEPFCIPSPVSVICVLSPQGRAENQ